MKNLIKKTWNAICTPFVAIACIIDESKIANEDGSWDKYHERNNRKEG